MLVDLARHVANSYVSSGGKLSNDEVLERIKAGFDAEWAHATSDAKNVTM